MLLAHEQGQMGADQPSQDRWDQQHVGDIETPDDLVAGEWTTEHEEGHPGARRPVSTA